MKYKLLILGKNKIWSDEFVTCLWKTYECLTASSFNEDLENHFKYFVPDAIIYCMDKENLKSINSVAYAHDKLAKGKIPLVIIGSKTDCSEFREHAPSVSVSLMLVRPIAASSLTEQINSMLDEKRAELENAQKLEQLEKEKKERLAELERLEQEKLAELERLEQERLEKIWALEDTDTSKKHILVVDDDPLMLKIIKEHISDKYDVATATRGKTALKFLEKRSTNLILLDYEMPDEKGPDVLEKLRANEETKNIPVIFLTGVTEKEKIQKALVNKPQGYLLKPIDHEKLMETINKFLK